MTVSESDTISRKAGKILAVNSDPEVIRILGVNLTHANLEFVSAQSGAEAIDKTFLERPDIILLGPPLPDIEVKDIYQRLQRSPQTSRIPLIVISSTKPKTIIASQSENGSIHYVTNPFDPNEIVSLVQAHLRQKKRIENVHPLTGLPNQAQVTLEMTELIEQKKAFAFIYIVIDNLRLFNKVYGYTQGDRSIRLLADIITEKVHLFSNPDDLAGHIEGNKFAIISTSPKARTLRHRIVAVFNRRIRDLYAEEDLERGYISYENPDGKKEQSPLMNLRAVLVTNQKRTFNHYLEVNEAATAEMDRLKRFPDGKSYPGLQSGDAGSTMAAAPGCVSSAQREDKRALSGVLDWLDFTIRELDAPLVDTRQNLDALSNSQKSLTPEHRKSLRMIRKKLNQLNIIIEGLNCLTRTRRLTAGTIFEEVDIAGTLDWVMKQVRETVKQRDIRIATTVADKLSPISIDRRTLTECLLYIIRYELQSLLPKARLEIRAAEMNEEFLTILIINPGNGAITDESGQINLDKLKDSIYPAKLMLQGLGGKLNVTHEPGEGTMYTLIVPKRWHSWMQEVSALQQATETSRKEAQSELLNIRHMLASLSEQVPSAMKDSLEKIQGRIQELGVLCNRTLFLTEDLNSRLEIQQESLLQQEVEQLASLEAILAMGREIASSMNLEHVFDLESSERVFKCALSIAREFKLSENDCQSLRYAAMVNDLGLVLSPQNLIERMLVASKKEATKIREGFLPMWKALSAIPFLDTALLYIRHINNMCDGDGEFFNTRGADIPLGAKILYLASSFERLTSGVSAREKLSPNQALQRIIDNSGRCFDPEVLNAFLQVWRQ